MRMCEGNKIDSNTNHSNSSDAWVTFIKCHPVPSGGQAVEREAGELCSMPSSMTQAVDSGLRATRSYTLPLHLCMRRKVSGVLKG